MDKQIDAPAVEANAFSALEQVDLARMPGLATISYGIISGLVTTALGAFIARRITGSLQLIMWVIATTPLAVVAIWFAEPGVLMVNRHLPSRRIR
jgi:hypothetical protein